jgi:hypothetical protein
MTARSSAWALGFCLSTVAAMGGLSAMGAMGCSSSSSGSPNNNSDNDSGDNEPTDGGSKGGSDATVANLDGGTPGTKDGSDDGSSPADGSSVQTAPSGVAAGDAGSAQFCAAVCSGLYMCMPDSGLPCNCTPGSVAVQRADIIAEVDKCIPSAFAKKCNDTGTALENCVVSATVASSPTAAISQFCKNLELTYCSDPNCLVDFGTLSDTAVTSVIACSKDLPDAAVDGGCTSFYTCAAPYLFQ